MTVRAGARLAIRPGGLVPEGRQCARVAFHARADQRRRACMSLCPEARLETQKALSEFRGLRSRRAAKITKIRSPRDYAEFPIEFSHGLQEFRTARKRLKIEDFLRDTRSVVNYPATFRKAHYATR
jgi:hypothetical protein